MPLLWVPITRRLARSSRWTCQSCSTPIKRGTTVVRTKLHLAVEGVEQDVPGWSHDACVEAVEPTLFGASA